MTSPLHGGDPRFESGRAHRFFFQSGAKIEPEAEGVEDEELHNFSLKLHNFSVADNDESLARTMTDRYIDENGNEHIEMLWSELLPEEGDDGVEWDEKNDPYMFKAEARFREALKREREAEQQAKDAKAQHKLSFTKDELDQYVANRTKGIAPKSRDWIFRSSETLWAITQGEISQKTVNALRDSVLDKYESADSHSKVLSFAKSFLKFLTTTNAEPPIRRSPPTWSCRKRSKSVRTSRLVSSLKRTLATSSNTLRNQNETGRSVLNDQRNIRRSFCLGRTPVNGAKQRRRS